MADADSPATDEEETAGADSAATVGDPAEEVETVREAVDRSRSGAPAAGSVVRDRFTSDEVFQRIIAAADEEITSGGRELFFSALAAGFAITITFLLYASLYGATGGDSIASALLYPLGFIYIIIGGYQLYTENTLPPVALTLERLASVPALLRNWGIVLAGNFTGGLAGAAVLAWGGVFSPEAATAAASLAEHGLETSSWSLFVKGAFAGLVVAGVVWVEYAARDTISRVVVVYLAFLAIPMGNLFHVVVSFTELHYLVFAEGLGVARWFAGMTEFVLPVLLGNTLGGILLVTFVNFYQTSEHRLESARFAGDSRRLSLREWVLGGRAGRSYVPLIDTAEPPASDEEAYRVLVPISNPRTETRLVDLAAAIASGHEDAIVHVVHVVQVPGRSSAASGGRQHERIVAESDELLSSVRGTVEGYDVGCETSTTVSHRSFEEIFDAAERENTDLVVMGWAEDGLWSAARVERRLSELTTQLPCDFLVLGDRGLDTSRILLPTAGGLDSDLGAEVARTLGSAKGSEITLLHVVDGPDEREAGERFLADWAADHELADATLAVDESGDVEEAVCREAADQTLLIMGAAERGLLSRLVSESLHFDVVSDVDCSVLLAERPTERTLVERLVGRR